MNAMLFKNMPKWPAIIAGLLIFLASVPPAKAENSRDSERNMVIEFKFGPFRPSIDSEFANGATPFEDTFGGGNFLLSRMEIDYQFLQSFGSLAVGGTIGYSNMSGHGIMADGAKSSDRTKMHLLPLSLDAVYRMDILARRFGVPFVPHIKGGFDYYAWWITNGVGKVPKVTVDGGKSTKGSGGTWGGHVVFGLSFLLDILAPDMAQTFDVDVGVNNTYLFAEYAMSWVDDFGSKNSFDLSSNTFLFGIAFEF